MSLSGRINAVRKLRGLSRAELVTKSELSQSMIAKLCSGHRGDHLSAAAAFAVARALDCDVTWLFTGEGEAPDGVDFDVDDSDDPTGPVATAGEVAA